MTSSARYRPLQSSLAFLFLLMIVWLAGTAGSLPAADDKPVESKPPEIKLPAVFDKLAPESIEELKAIQNRVKVVLEKVIPCTVGVQIGGSSGSGVIVSKEGHVLTAGHVSGTPGKDCTLILSDGKRVKGKTLGLNKGIDSGMIQIVEKDKEWPFIEMGISAELKPGTWCIATGHPGGYKTGRSPVVRVGRIIINGKTAVTSDCCLVGGDSGGPLFDMNGKIIGIQSRIGGSITANVHVPVDTYRDTWDKLVKSESIGGIPGFPVGGNEPYLGVQGDPDSKDCVITQVVKDSPAEKAGLKVNDVIQKFEGQMVEKFDALVELVRKKKPGDEVALEVKRGDESLTLKLKVGRRGD